MKEHSYHLKAISRNRVIFQAASYLLQPITEMSRNIHRLDLVHRQVETFLSTGARRLRMNKCHKWGLKTRHPKKKNNRPKCCLGGLSPGNYRGIFGRVSGCCTDAHPTTEIGD